jgi:hypothetical protein
VADSASRAADDETVIDKTCIAAGDPYTYCQGKQYAYKRSKHRPPCSDNNVTLNTLSGCYYPNGTYSTKCVQVGYSQNAFIALCGQNRSCGTYLEIHMTEGSPYQLETDVIAEVKLLTRNTSGMYTTVMPLTWMGNNSRVLCSYTESFLRVGSIVYILPSASVCCCPAEYETFTRAGSFFCPIGATGDGPFASKLKSLAEVLSVDEASQTYPFCPGGLESNDRFVISHPVASS